MSREGEVVAKTIQQLNRGEEEARIALDSLGDEGIAEVIAQATALALDCNDKIEKIFKKAELENLKIRIVMDDGTEDESKDKKIRNGKTRTYVNPDSGETLTTAGHNNKILKGWYAQYGKEVVQGWIQK